MSGKPWHRGKHTEFSRLLRSHWNAHPDTRCTNCHRTRAEGIAKWGEQGEWDAGHITPSTIARSVLDYQPQHRHCNRSEGAATGNAKREPNSGWLTR